MTRAEEITERLAEFLGQEVQAQDRGGIVSVLTPAEYPDGDGVVVFVEPAGDGGYVISDHGEADATLIGNVGPRAVGEPAGLIARRFDARFDNGQITTHSDEDSLAEACWRVAQAAAAVAEAATYVKPSRAKEAEFTDVVQRALRKRRVKVETERRLEGASGHTHRASIYVPATETVIEPIYGDKAWNVAAAVYVEFGDLRQANGYRLYAVVDDRSVQMSSEVGNLLSQVAEVAPWSAHDQWLSGLAGDQLS